MTAAPKRATWEGLDIVFEPPIKLRYGYIRGTKGEDGQALDCLLGKHLDSKSVFVFDKVRQRTREFDETKILIGFYSMKGALKGWRTKYRANQLGKQRELTVKEFFHKLDKKWRK